MSEFDNFKLNQNFALMTGFKSSLRLDQEVTAMMVFWVKNLLILLFIELTGCLVRAT